MSFGRGRGAALSARVLTGIVESLKQHGTVLRGYLGIGTQPVEISSQIRERLGISQVAGLLIVSVEANSPADQAGLFVGDVIATVDGREMDDPRVLRSVLARTGAGATINLRVVRAGQAAEITAVLRERESGSEDENRFGHVRRRERGRRSR
jgi:serine protease Do